MYKLIRKTKIINLKEGRNIKSRKIIIDFFLMKYKDKKPEIIKKIINNKIIYEYCKVNGIINFKNEKTLSKFINNKQLFEIHGSKIINCIKNNNFLTQKEKNKLIFLINL